MPSASVALARNVAASLARTLFGPVSTTDGAWLPSVTVPSKSSSSAGGFEPIPQPGVSGGRGSESLEHTLSTTTR